MTAPAISIVLCTYNGARFLPAQLDSLLRQVDGDFEIVAVDDASTDATPAILRDYAARDARLRVHANAATLGLQRNFERAFRLAHGALIAPCDQDDVWAPRKLATLRARLGDATLVYSDSELIDDAGHSLGRRVSDRHRMVDGADARAFAFANCVSGHAMLFRRELLARALPLPDGVYYDWWLAAVAAATGRIAYVDECLVQFRQHGGGASRFDKARAPSRPRQERWRRYDGERRALEALAAQAPPAQRAFFDELVALWRARAHQAWSPRLVGLLMRHSGSVYATRPGPHWLKWRHALKHLRGLRGSAPA